MKGKLNILLITIGVFLLSGFSSCNSDGYSPNDHYSSIVTVHTGSDGYAQYFTLDNGETMFVASTETYYKPKNKRVFINYTILAKNAEGYEDYDYVIRLNGYLEDILTKNIIDAPIDDQEEQDIIGYDKIKVESIYAKGGFVTIKFAFKMAGKDSHLLNLVALSENKVQEGDKPIKLEFRHNKNNDEEHYISPSAHVCFNLDEYIAANQGNTDLEFEVSWQEYSGERKSVLLKYPLSAVEEE